MQNQTNDNLGADIVIWISKAIFFIALFYGGVTHDWSACIYLFIGHIVGKAITIAERDPKAIN